VFGTILRRCPRGILGAIVIVMIVESWLARQDLEFTRPEGINLRMARLAARKHAPTCEVLCLGSSMIHSGVLPAALDRHSRSKSYNLAVVAGTTSTSYYILKEAIDAGARPRAVVLDVHPAFILADNRDRNHFWVDCIGTADLVDLGWTLRDPDDFADILLRKIFRSLYHRDPIRLATLHALRGERFSERAPNLTMMRNLNQNRGAFVTPRPASYQGEISPVYQRVWLSDNHRRGSSPSAELYMHRLLQLAHEHGIRVYWVNLPLVPELNRQREAKGWNEVYDRFTKNFLAYPNLVVIDARTSGYEPSVFNDASHLSPEGAYVLSREIAEILDRDKFEPRLTEESRWMKLPPFLERRPDIPLEDYNTSAIAIAQPSAIRR